MAILADSFYYQELRIDTINTRVFADLVAKEGDANGRGLLVTLTENGLMKNTTGIALNLKWEHTSVGNQGVDNFEVVDLSKGLYKITYPTEMLNRGKIRAFIQIIDSGKLAGTRNIEITVDRGVGDDTAIASSNSFSALASALIEVQSWNDRIDDVEQDFIDRANNLDATYPTRLVSAEQQLAEKRNKFEAIMMEDLHTEVKSAMTGGSVAVVGINSIGTENIKNKAVTGAKVDFLSQTKNLLNPYTIVMGKKLSSDGALYDDLLYQTSDFIEVKNGVTYTISKKSYYINMYTPENVFLSVLSSGTKTIPFTFIAPQDGYIRVTYLTILSLSVTVGDDISLDPYGFRPNENVFNLNDAIKKTHIKNNAVSTQKTDFIIHSKNLFNKHDLEIIQGKYISSTGVLTDNPPTFVSGKIPVVPGEKYITTFFSNLNDNNCGTYYNERDERIDTVTGVTTGSYRVITVPKNEMISYMKINHVLSTKEVLMIVKGEIYPDQYVSFYKRLDKTFVVSDDLLSDNIKSTTQSIVFNADRSVQKIQHKDSFGGIVRDDVFTYTTNQITEVRTLSDGRAVTYKYHLDTLETEII